MNIIGGIKVKIAICDDDLQHCGKLETFILDICKEVNTDVDVDVYTSGEEMLDKNGDDCESPDIAFLDIEMKGFNGIETARKLRETDRHMLIIYITSYTQYTMESFEVSPFRYLLKPIDKKSIEKVLIEAMNEIFKNHESLFLKLGNRQIQIYCDDIITVNSECGRMVRLNTQKVLPSQLFYAKIKDIEKQLSPLDFVKVNQGTIVNLKYAYIVSSDEIQMTTGQSISISRGRKKHVKELFALYVKRAKNI